MASRIGLVVLLIVCVIGMGWLLGAEEDGSHVHERAGESRSGGDAPAPGLATVDAPAPSVPPAGPTRPLPEWFRSKGPKLPDRAVVWILADPRNFDDFVAEIVRTSRHRGLRGTHVAALSQFWRFASDPRVLRPWILARLASEDLDAFTKAALLGALTRLDLGRGTQSPSEVLRLVWSGEDSNEIRILAAQRLLQSRELTPAEVDAVSGLLREVSGSNQLEALPLLHILSGLGARAAPFVPVLLEIRPRIVEMPGGTDLILKILAKAAPGDPRAMELFLDGLGHPKPALQRLCLEALAQGGEDAILGLVGRLETATAAARVEGAALLMEKGLATDRVPGLLLAALASGGARVRDRAITLLARAAPDPRRALPVIEELLKSDDRGRWISGTKALGALTTGAGARDDIMQLLFTAARLPDPKVRVLAVQSLLMYDDHAKAVIPVLADLLQDSEVHVRREAVDGLGEMAARDEGARVYLQAALGDSDESVRKLAKYWLEMEDDD